MLLNELERLENESVLYIKESILCPICQARSSSENDKLSLDNPAIRLKSCLHEICKDCIIKAASQSTNPYVVCPIAQCQIVISDRELRTVCGEAVMSRLHDISVASVLDRRAQDTATSQSELKLFNALKELDIKKIVECDDETPCRKCCPKGERQFDNGEYSVIRLKSCLHEICTACIIEFAKKSEFLPVKCPLDNCEFYILESELKTICPANIIRNLENLTDRN